jgi:hypothetical protein
MLIFFGIINFMESNMNARDALVRIEALLEAGLIPTSDGFSLPRDIYDLVFESINIGLEDTDVQN